MLLRHQLLLKKKLSITNKATVTFVVESMTWTIALFSTNRLSKREIGHWQKGSCVMGVIYQLLQTIMPELKVTEGYVTFVIKSILLVCMGMCQREEAEATLQLYLQLIL